MKNNVEGGDCLKRRGGLGQFADLRRRLGKKVLGSVFCGGGGGELRP